MKFGNNIDLVKNQILNFALQNLSAAPGSPVAGMPYFNTTTNAEYVWNGTAWVCTDASKLVGVIPLAALAVDPVARANHTGTQTASTISDLTTVLNARSLSSFAEPTANLAMGGYTLTGLNTNPNASGQAAEYSWVLNQISASASGIKAIKDPVRVLFITNQALSGIPTAGSADNVTLADGDRVLLKGQTTAHENRIWVIHSGAWTAPTDFDQSTDITGGTEVLVNEGTTYAGSVWRLTTTGAIVLATTSLAWTQVNQLNTYSNGNGLDLSGTIFSVKLPANSGLTVNGTGVFVDRALVPNKYSANIGDGSTTSIVVTHNLNTQDIVLSVREVATQNGIMVDWQPTTVNTATLTFSVAPTAAQYRVTVIG